MNGEQWIADCEDGFTYAFLLAAAVVLWPLTLLGMWRRTHTDGAPSGTSTGGPK